MAATRESEFISPLPADSLFIRRMVGEEELGRLPEYRVIMHRERSLTPIKAADLLGKNVTVQLLLDNGENRFINGWVTSFENGDTEGRFDLYEIEMRPWLWYLTLGADCRIFQDKSALEIIQAVFGDYSSQLVENKLTGNFRKRKFCVQYRESDFAFVSRLMEEEGIYHYFTHAKGQHTLVLCNSASAHPELAGGHLDWARVQITGRKREDVITAWKRVHSVQSLKYTHTDYDYEAPTTALLADASRSVAHPTPNDLEVFDYPGAYDDLAQSGNAGGKKTEGARLAKLRTHAFASRQDTAQALTPFRSVAAGLTFVFNDHPVDEGEFLITSARFEFSFGGYEAAEETAHGFNASLEVLPKNVEYQPTPITPRPTIAGPQTGVVVGPSGDEIHTDPLGRVKVQFRWDRIGTANENSSCFVRVSQPWASKGFGFIAIPRIGDEVVVEFLEGNPDRPLVTGRVYNGVNAVPYTLPANATISGGRTRSSKEGGAGNFNELKFEDKKGSEYVSFRSEKDYYLMVKHDAFESVTNDLWTKVGKNVSHVIGETLTVDIGKTATLHAGADVNVTLDTDVTMKIGGALNLAVTNAVAAKADDAVALTVGKALAVDVGQALAITAVSSMHLKGLGVVIDGGSSLTIKAGGSFISLDGGGVTISGAMVKINSGGAAGTANAADKASPPAAKPPAPPKEYTNPSAT